MPADAALDGVPTISELYETYADGLRRYAASLAQDADRGDDLVSETFLEAMANLPLLGRLNTYQRKSWMYRVLKNRFIDQLRAHQREKVLVQQLAWMKTLSEPGVASGEVFAQIPAQHRELFQLSYVQGLTSEEIGRKLGIPAATVRSRLHLAIQWLRKYRSNLGSFD